MPRLFVAVRLPATVRDRLERAVDPLRSDARARWIPAENYHITIAFLGSVPSEQVTGIEEALAAAARASSVFRLHMDGTLGRFSSRVLWAAVGGDEQALDGLAGKVRAGVADVGVPMEERPFHAHVTLARARRGGRVPRVDAAAWDGDPASWRVTELSLQESTPGPKGSRYEEVRAWPLADA